MIITKLFLQARVLESHSFLYQSLLLSTTVLNDKGMYQRRLDTLTCTALMYGDFHMF